MLQAQGWLNWFTCVCVTGLAQLGVTYVCYRRRDGSIGSLVCVTGLTQGAPYVCYRRRVGSVGSFECVTDLA